MSTTREMTFADVLRFVGALAAAEDNHSAAQAMDYDQNSGGGCGCGSQPAPVQPGCGCRGPAEFTPSGCGCSSNAAPAQASCTAAFASNGSGAGLVETESGSVLDKRVGRRHALGMLFGGLAAGAQLASACSPLSPASEDEKEARLLEWRERIKTNYRLMTDEERSDTIARLERLAHIRRNETVRIQSTSAQPNVMYGYAFNISKCEGYRSCVQACINENNLDRRAGTQYIRIFEIENGVIDLEEGDATYMHEVPAEGHFYMGTQCFQCANPPCVKVCPVGATWQEPDGITVIDYDWCIGCRYCMAACPYWARRFNWAQPEVPAEVVNPNQHYLGNRARKQGVVEKCTFCIQRTRQGRLPACAEACPTGARVFGNLLDPNSEIRWVLEHKPVFRLKEDLATEPRFWYFTD